MHHNALCYTSGPSGGSSAVEVRIHSEIERGGDLPGTSLSFAENAVDVVHLVFKRADHVPAYGNVYSITDVEAYQVDTVEPPDGITVKAACRRMVAADAALYAPPATP